MTTQATRRCASARGAVPDNNLSLKGALAMRSGTVFGVSNATVQSGALPTTHGAGSEDNNAGRRSALSYASAGSEVSVAKFAGEASSLQQGAAHLEELFSWMAPRHRDTGFLSTFAKLSVEVQQITLDWRAELSGGGGYRHAMLLAAEDPPPDPLRTAQAASLLLQVVRSFPAGTMLRNSLEPLTQEVMLATYEHWPSLDSLDDLQEAETRCEALTRYTPYYTLVKGHVAHAERSAATAAAATVHAAQQAATAAEAVGDFESLRNEVKELRDALTESQQKHAAAEAEANELREEYKKFRQSSKQRLEAFDSVKEELEICKDDLKHNLRDLNAQHARNDALMRQMDAMRKEISHVESERDQLNRQISKHRAEVEEVPKMRRELAAFKCGERYHEVRFADRISNDVFGESIETLCGGGPHSAAAKAAAVVADTSAAWPLSPSHARGSPLSAQSPPEPARGSISAEAEKALRPEVVHRMLDHLCQRLRALPKKIFNLESDLDKLEGRYSECRKLVPVWNADAIVDIEDAYDDLAPVHRQTYSESDPRCFAGLGFGTSVPLYLQAEGLVRHVFVSKAELEDFMSSFLNSLFAPTAVERPNTGNAHGAHSAHGMRRRSVTDASALVELNTEQLHTELYHFMKRHVEKETKDSMAANQARIEFAYALTAGIEAHRHDPDFELFDLMLCGAVHPTVTQDAREMLKSLERLLRECQEGLVTEEAHGGRRGAGSRPTNGARDRGLVSKRMIRAALLAVFPDKSAAHHNAIIRALHATIQSLDAGARTPSSDSVYVADLFAQTQDGAQTPFVEEVRRQHYYEILDFARAIRGRLDNTACGSAMSAERGALMEQELTCALKDLDAHTATNSIDDLVRMAMEPPPRLGAVTPPSRPPSARGRGRVNSRVPISRPSSAECHSEVSLTSASSASSVGMLLRRLRRRTLLRPRRLWVRAESSDVVRAALKSAHGADQFHGLMEGNRKIRSRGIMVVENPVAKMEDDEVMGWADGDTAGVTAPKLRGRLQPSALEIT